MEGTLIGLFVLSAILLAISIIKTNIASKVNHKEVDMVHISIMKEINSIQESMRAIELDIEVIMKESGIQLSVEEKQFMREVIDLHRRNYSIESIAEKKQATVNDIEKALAPYLKLKDEGSKVAYAN